MWMGEKKRKERGRSRREGERRIIYLGTYLSPESKLFGEGRFPITTQCPPDRLDDLLFRSSLPGSWDRCFIVWRATVTLLLSKSSLSPMNVTAEGTPQKGHRDRS